MSEGTVMKVWGKILRGFTSFALAATMVPAAAIPAIALPEGEPATQEQPAEEATPESAPESTSTSTPETSTPFNSGASQISEDKNLISQTLSDGSAPSGNSTPSDGSNDEFTQNDEESTAPESQTPEETVTSPAEQATDVVQIKKEEAQLKEEEKKEATETIKMGVALADPTTSITFAGSAFLLHREGTAEWLYPTDSQFTGELIIPDTVSNDGVDYPVTAISVDSTIKQQAEANIAADADADVRAIAIAEEQVSIRGTYDGITSLVIPSSVESIDAAAFSIFPNLKTFTFENGRSNSAYTIYSGAIFATDEAGDPESLVALPAAMTGTLLIPATVTDVPASAVSAAMKLDAIDVVEGNEIYARGDGSPALLSKDGATLVAYPVGSSLNVKIPTAVKTIAAGAFWNCDNIATICAPSSVENIANAAYGTAALSQDSSTNYEGATKSLPAFPPDALDAQVIITDVSQEDAEAFAVASKSWQDAGFANVVGSEAAPKDGASAKDSQGVLYTMLPDGSLSASWGGSDQSDAALEDQKNVDQPYAGSAISIPAETDVFGMPMPVSEVASGGFAGLTWLASVDVNVPYIRESAFADCSQLISVSLGAGVERIEARAFAGDGLQGNLVLPDGIAYVGDSFIEGVDGINIIVLGTPTFVSQSALLGATSIRAYVPAETQEVWSAGLASAGNSIAAYSLNGQGEVAFMVGEERGLPFKADVPEDAAVVFECDSDKLLVNDARWTMTAVGPLAASIKATMSIAGVTVCEESARVRVSIPLQSVTVRFYAADKPEGDEAASQPVELFAAETSCRKTQDSVVFADGAIVRVPDEHAVTASNAAFIYWLNSDGQLTAMDEPWSTVEVGFDDPENGEGEYLYYSLSGATAPICNGEVAVYLSETSEEAILFESSNKSLTYDGNVAGATNVPGSSTFAYDSASQVSTADIPVSDQVPVHPEGVKFGAWEIFVDNKTTGQYVEAGGKIAKGLSWGSGNIILKAEWQDPLVKDSDTAYHGWTGNAKWKVENNTLTIFPASYGDNTVGYYLSESLTRIYYPNNLDSFLDSDKVNAAFPWTTQAVATLIRTISVDKGVNGSLSMQFMFSKLPNLNAFDVYNLSVSDGADLAGMFYKSGTDASDFDVVLVDCFNQKNLNMLGMFVHSGVRNATLKKFGNGDGDGTYNNFVCMNGMFRETPKLNKVTLDDVGNGIGASLAAMFYGAKLRELTLNKVGNADGCMHNMRDDATGSNIASRYISSNLLGKCTNIVFFACRLSISNLTISNSFNGDYLLAAAAFQGFFERSDCAVELTASFSNVGNGDDVNFQRCFQSFGAQQRCVVHFSQMLQGYSPQTFALFEYACRGVDEIYFTDVLTLPEGKVDNTTIQATQFLAPFNQDFTQENNPGGYSSRIKIFKWTGKGASNPRKINLQSAFRYCSSLETFEIKTDNGLPFIKAITLNSFLAQCKNLREVDLSAIDTSEEPPMWNMFGGMAGTLKHVTIGKTFSTIRNGFFDFDKEKAGKKEEGSWDDTKGASSYGNASMTADAVSYTNDFELWVYGGPQSSDHLWPWMNSEVYPGKIHLMDGKALSVEDSVWVKQNYKLSSNIFEEEYGNSQVGGYAGAADDGENGQSVRWFIGKPDANVETYTLIIFPTDYLEGTLMALSESSSEVWPWQRSDNNADKYLSKVTKARVMEGVYVSGSLYRMFAGMSSLQTLDVTGLEERKEGPHADSFKEMFKDCNRLTELEITNLANGDGVNPTNMFDGCGNLQKLTLRHVGNGLGANLANWFRDDEKIQSMLLEDVGNGNLDGASTSYTDMSHMLAFMKALRTLTLNNVGNGFGANMFRMVAGNTSTENTSNNHLSVLSITKVGEGNSNNRSWATDGNADIGTYADGPKGKVTNMANFAAWQDSIEELTIDGMGNGNYSILAGAFVKAGYGAQGPVVFSIENFGNGVGTNMQRCFQEIGSIEKGGSVSFKKSVQNACGSLFCLFELASRGIDSLVLEDFLTLKKGVSSEEVLIAANFIPACFSGSTYDSPARLKSIKWTGEGRADARLIDLSNAFRYVNSLSKFEVTSTNAQPLFRVTSFYKTFDHCTSLKDIDLQAFDTSKCTTSDSMYQMFGGLQNTLQNVTIGEHFTRINSGMIQCDMGAHKYSLFVYGGPVDKAFLVDWEGSTPYAGKIYLLGDDAERLDNEVWKPSKYSVSQGAYRVVFNVDGVISDTRMVDNGGLIVAPDTEAMKPGYQFSGWYEDIECLGKEWVFAGANADTVTKDITLYAKTHARKYKIELKKNIPSGSLNQESDVSYWPADIPDVSYDGGWTIEKAANPAEGDDGSPKMPGYAFLGWSLKKEAVTADYASGVSTRVNLIIPQTESSDKVELFAVWSANPNNSYTVRVHKMTDGAYTSYEDKAFTGRTDLPIEINTNNWIPTSNTCSYTYDTSKNSSDGKDDSGNYNFIKGQIAPRGNTIFHLYYKQRITVTLEAGTTATGNPSISGTTSFVMDYNGNFATALSAAATTPAGKTTPTVSYDADKGFVHYGWTAVSKATGKDIATYKVAHSLPCEADKSERKDNDVIPVHENMTLKAVWSGRPYTINFYSGEYKETGTYGETAPSGDVYTGERITKYWCNTGNNANWDVPDVNTDKTRKGYKIAKWRNVTNAGGINPTIGKKGSELAAGTARNAVGKDSNLTDKYCTTVSFNAIWTAQTFQVKFKHNATGVANAAHRIPASAVNEATAVAFSAAGDGAKAYRSGDDVVVVYTYRDKYDSSVKRGTDADKQKIPSLTDIWTRLGYIRAAQDWSQNTTPSATNRTGGTALGVGAEGGSALYDLLSTWDAGTLAFTGMAELTGRWANDTFQVTYSAGGQHMKSADAATLAGLAGTASSAISGASNGSFTVTYTYYDALEYGTHKSQKVPEPNAVVAQNNKYPSGKWACGTTGTGAPSGSAGVLSQQDLTALFNAYATSNPKTPVSYAIEWHANPAITYDMGIVVNGAGKKVRDAVDYNSSDSSKKFTTIDCPSEYMPYQSATLGTATCAGYVFKGWYTTNDDSGERVTTFNTDPYSDDNTYQSKTFYAHWTAITYSVNFDKNKGAGSLSADGDFANIPDVVSLDYGAPLTIPLKNNSVPTRVGYTFKGWATSAGGSVAYVSNKLYAAGEANLMVPTGAAGEGATLYAVWEANDVDLKVHVYVQSSSDGQYVEYAQAGYPKVLVGKADSTRAITSEEIAAMTPSSPDCTYKYASAPLHGASNVLSGQLDPRGTTDSFKVYYNVFYNVTFKPGDRGTFSGVTIPEGFTAADGGYRVEVPWSADPISSIAKPVYSGTDSGYELVGWTGNGSEYAITHPTKTDKGDVAAADDPITVRSNLTLTGKWGAKAYTIAFDQGEYQRSGGAAVPLADSHKKERFWNNTGDSAKWSFPDSSAVGRKGYKLTGWKNNAYNGTYAKDNAAAAGSEFSGAVNDNTFNLTSEWVETVTFSAVWQAQTFDVALGKGAAAAKLIDGLASFGGTSDEPADFAAAGSGAKAYKDAGAGSLALRYTYRDEWDADNPRAASDQKVPPLGGVYERKGYAVAGGGWKQGDAERSGGAKLNSTPGGTSCLFDLLAGNWDAGSFAFGGSTLVGQWEEKTFQVTYSGGAAQVDGTEVKGALKGSALTDEGGLVAATGAVVDGSPAAGDESFTVTYRYYDDEAYGAEGVAAAAKSQKYPSPNAMFEIADHYPNGYWTTGVTGADGTVGDFIAAATLDKLYDAYLAGGNRPVVIEATWESNPTIEYQKGDVINESFVNHADNPSNISKYDTVTLEPATCKGYTFDKWVKVASDGTETDIAVLNGAEIQAAGGITVKAVWTANSYTVVFDANLKNNVDRGGAAIPEDDRGSTETFTLDRNAEGHYVYANNDGSGKATFEVPADGVDFHDKTFAVCGHELVGWAKTSDATEAVYSASEGKTGTFNDLLPADPDDLNSVITLYAVWREKTYTVSFEQGDADCIEAAWEDGKDSGSAWFAKAYPELNKKYLDSFEIPSDKPTHIGYTCPDEAWVSKADSKIKASAGQSVTPKALGAAAKTETASGVALTVAPVKSWAAQKFDVKLSGGRMDANLKSSVSGTPADQGTSTPAFATVQLTFDGSDQLPRVVDTFERENYVPSEFWYTENTDQEMGYPTSGEQKDNRNDDKTGNADIATKSCYAAGITLGHDDYVGLYRLFKMRQGVGNAPLDNDVEPCLFARWNPSLRFTVPTLLTTDFSIYGGRTDDIPLNIYSTNVIAFDLEVQPEVGESDVTVNGSTGTVKDMADWLFGVKQSDDVPGAYVADTGATGQANKEKVTVDFYGKTPTAEGEAAPEGSSGPQEQSEQGSPLAPEDEKALSVKLFGDQWSTLIDDSQPISGPFEEYDDEGKLMQNGGYRKAWSGYLKIDALEPGTATTYPSLKWMWQNTSAAWDEYLRDNYGVMEKAGTGYMYPDNVKPILARLNWKITPVFTPQN